MSKKSESFYFDNFVQSASIACDAAQMLKSILTNFSVDTLHKSMEDMHTIEHSGDIKKHEMTSQLVRAFITPIERDDIIKLSQNLDDVTDAIEDIIIHIYMCNITSIRKDSIEFADIIIKCCNTMKEMLVEFPNFKKPKRLEELIIEINRLEEVGDAMYIGSMRTLHSGTEGALDIIAWREIYTNFEMCCDACEDVADIVENIAIVNT
ncbi:MAG: DUF47 family protein [Oscillospiraceae bacterium]